MSAMRSFPVQNPRYLGVKHFKSLKYLGGEIAIKRMLKNTNGEGERERKRAYEEEQAHSCGSDSSSQVMSGLKLGQLQPHGDCLCGFSTECFSFLRLGDTFLSQRSQPRVVLRLSESKERERLKGAYGRAQTSYVLNLGGLVGW